MPLPLPAAPTAVLFDLDGTLWDPFRGFVTSMNLAMRALGYPELSHAQMRPLVGPPLHQSLRAFVRPDEVELAIRIYRAYYADHGLTEGALYPAIPALLAQLHARGVKILTATTKREVYAQTLLERLGLAHYFHAIVGGQGDGPGAEKANVIARALAQLTPAERAAVVMVGDRIYDLEGAAAHALPCIAVTWGYAEPAELAAASAHAATAAELAALLGFTLAAAPIPAAPAQLPRLAELPDRYRFHFCPRCATPLEVAILHDLERQRCPQCRWIHFPLPNLAATVVIEHADGIVLVQRDIEPDRGIWHLPIGHLEYGEDPADAALREGHEETGLILAEPRFLGYTHSPSYADPRMLYIVFAFTARAIGGTLTGSHEGQATRIIPFGELHQLELKWTSQQHALQQYLAGR